MKMVVESMEMAPGALPRPGRVPKQRLLSPETCRRWRRRLWCFCQIWHIPLGLSRRGVHIGERVASEGSCGPHTTWWRGRHGTRATIWCGRPTALQVLSFGLLVVH